MNHHIYKLTSTGLLPLRFLHSFETQIVMVTTPRSITVNDGVVLTLGSGLEQPDLPVGKKVRVWLSRWFYCELAEAAKEREEKRRQEKLRDEERLNICREESEAFNACLNVPVKWRTGMKDVLSGLSPTSAGNGINKSTVGHIELLEPLAEGRLSREAGEFLCSRNKGKQWSDNSHLRCYDGNGNLYDAKVTCKACLKMAQRWKT